MPTVKVTDASFKKDVLDQKVPVLVDFWAAWCGPCRAVAPVLEELSDEYAGQMIIAKVDVDANPQLSAAMRIQSIPTMVLFKDGRPIQAVMGAYPKPQLTELLKKWLPELGGATKPGDLPLTIKPKDLAEKLKRGERFVLLDLRRVQDFDRSHLKGSRAVDAEQVAQEVQRAGVPAVLIDRTGELSKTKAEELRKEGIAVCALEKGLLEWEGSGLPTFSTREEQEADQQAR